VSLFGRRQRSALDVLQGASWTCAQCGADHEGMFDLAADAPVHWDGAEVYEPNGALRRDGDFLSEDFCVLGGEHFFVRCVFDIPVHGMAEKFGLGVWSTLSRVTPSSATVKALSIVKAYQGTMHVDRSEEFGGARFTVVLPPG